MSMMVGELIAQQRSRASRSQDGRVSAERQTVNEMNDGIAAVQSRIADLQRRFGPRTPATTSAGDTDAASLNATGLSGTTPDFASLLAQLQGSAMATTAGASSGAESTAVGDMRSTAARQRFGSDLLKRLGLPQTRENLRAMMAWQAAEGTTAAFNPLATTRAAPGATDMNSVGVKNFRTYEQGLQTTIDTLRNGLYGNILAALRDGTSATRVAQAIAESPWGTGDGVSTVLASGVL
jgi:hypothetical protein